MNSSFMKYSNIQIKNIGLTVKNAVIVFIIVQITLQNKKLDVAFVQKRNFAIIKIAYYVLTTHLQVLIEKRLRVGTKKILKHQERSSKAQIKNTGLTAKNVVIVFIVV